jgi:hypothetical protein
MNYKIVISGLLSLSSVACSYFPSTAAQTWPMIDHFQIRDNVILDTRSNLMWSRCLLGENWNGITCEGNTAIYNWQQMQAAVKTLNYAGYSDWRVPTLDELKLLADRETVAPVVKIPRLNQMVFPMPHCLGMENNLNSDGHRCWQWSSTPIEGSDHYAWIVYFGYGYGSANYEADAFALRLVRNNR